MANDQERDLQDEFFRESGHVSFDKVLKDCWKGFMQGTHTIMPGQIVSYDATKRLASVQPVLKEKFLWKDAPTPIDAIPGVPVVQWAGIAGACMFIPDSLIVAGLEVLLLVCERSIDRWYGAGGLTDPADTRMFDFTDSIAFLGMCSLPNIPTRNGATSSLEVQYGTAYIEITSAQKFVVKNASASLKQIQSDIVSMVSNAQSPPGTAGGPLIFTTPSPSTVNAEISNLFV